MFFQVACVVVMMLLVLFGAAWRPMCLESMQPRVFPLGFVEGQIPMIFDRSKCNTHHINSLKLHFLGSSFCFWTFSMQRWFPTIVFEIKHDKFSCVSPGAFAAFIFRITNYNLNLNPLAVSNDDRVNRESDIEPFIHSSFASCFLVDDLHYTNTPAKTHSWTS